MNAHTIHGQLEELVFTGVTSSDPPANLDDLLKELENAKTNPELIVPDLDLVIQYLKRLETFSLLHITETTEVPTHSLVEALYRARQDHFCGGASGMTELEAALAAFCIEHGLSQAQRQDLCNLHFNRGLISAGLAPRMDGHSQAAMVPAFEEVCLNFDEADVQNFGPLKVWVRDIVSVMWYILCDPAVHLPTDLAKQYEELYDPECVAGNDPCRGAMSPDICNSLWFKHAYARVPKGFLLHPAIFFSDGTVCGRMNGRNVHAMFAANGAMRTSARNQAPGMRLIALLIPPTGGAGLVAAGTEALKLRSNRYFQQVLHHFGEALRAIGQHGVTLPLPLNGQLETWERQKCALLLMGFCGDVEERLKCACVRGGHTANRPCPKCNTCGGPALLEPVETNPTSTAALMRQPREPRNPTADNAFIDECAAAAVRAGTVTHALDAMHERGLRGAKVVDDIPGYDSKAMLMVDDMHTADGLTRRLAHGAIVAVTTGLGSQDANALVRLLNMRVRLCTAFPGPRGTQRLPPGDLFVHNSDGAQLGAQFTCAEMAATVWVLPYVFARWPRLSKVLQSWAELHNEIRNPCPDWRAARRLYVLYQRLLKAFDDSALATVLTEGLNTVKTHDILHIGGQRIGFGAAANLGLQQMEHEHMRSVKRPFYKTDRRKTDIEGRIGAALVRAETEDLNLSLIALHHVHLGSENAAVAAKWRALAGMAKVKDKSLRGRGKRAGMPSSLTLGSLADLPPCDTPIGRCDLSFVERLIQESLQLETGGPTLCDPERPVCTEDVVEPYTVCKVAGAGRHRCIESWAHARPSASAPQFDFVAFPAMAADGSRTLVEAVGFLVLVFTCASVREPLVLLRMLRQQPPGAAVYARAAFAAVRVPLIDGSRLLQVARVRGAVAP